MKGLEAVITGSKLITPGKPKISDNLGLRPGRFKSIPDHFPQGLPRRLSGLDKGTKFLLVAVTEALQGGCVTGEQTTGVAISTFLGTNSSRIKFLQGILETKKIITDPIAFKTTVPSVAAGAVAILCQCQGPTLTLIGTGEAGLAALHNTCLLMQRGIINEMIVGGYEDLPDELLTFLPKKLKGKRLWLEGAGALIVKDKKSAKEKREKILAEISGFGICARGFAPHQKKEALRQAIDIAVNQSSQKTIDYMVSAESSYSTTEHAMFPNIPLIDVSVHWGECLGMSGIIRLMTAIERINDKKATAPESNRTINVLVNGIGTTGTAYSVLLSG